MNCQVFLHLFRSLTRKTYIKAVFIASLSIWSFANAQTLGAENRLIEIYKLIGQGHAKLALPLAQRLSKDHPNFQLAQLVYGDLLLAQTQPLRQLAQMTPDLAFDLNYSRRIAELKSEALLRIQALQENPPEGHLPSNILDAPAHVRHIIAVDASRARLYLFQNSAQGLQLVRDFYMSVGKAGTDKYNEGDNRTPLGIYFTTGRMVGRTLPEFYGAGALPLNYPNAFDKLRGKTGSGIWLHGSPPAQFARAPLASEGCVVLSNADFEQLLRTVDPQHTPVIIAKNLNWVKPEILKTERTEAADLFQIWLQARVDASGRQLRTLYTPEALRQTELPGASAEYSNPMVLRWNDNQTKTMVFSFEEIRSNGNRKAASKIRRQFWLNDGSGWRIFHEGAG